MIKAVYENGYSQMVYDVFIAFCFVSVIVFGLWYGSKYKMSKRQSLIAALCILFTTYAFIYVYSWGLNSFQTFGNKNLVHGFIYIPLFAYPISRMLKLDWLSVCDFFAPLPALAQSVSKIGCTFAGCCHGYPWEFGIYNPILNKTTFPVQIVECVTYLTIVIFIVLYSKQKKYKADGASYSLMLILFGSSRFLFEFVRDNHKLVFGCSSLAFHAAFMVIVGVVALVIIRKIQQRYVVNP